EGGKRIALDGELPINTNGGQLSGGRTHGLGYVHEACLQRWGRAEGRQTTENRVCAVAAGGGPLGGSLLLVREQLLRKERRSVRCRIRREHRPIRRCPLHHADRGTSLPKP